MIRNLLFDLGGVIMDIRRQNCVEAFKALGMDAADSYLGEYCQAGPFEGIENGTYTVPQFHEAIRRLTGADVSDSEIDTAFGKFLTGIPVHRLRELECLHRKFGMYMLSNTNPIMWADGINRFFRADGHDVDYYFDGIVKSYEVGAMKPDPLIFRMVIDRYGLVPAETIFFDDSQRNLYAARKFRFNTVLVEPGTEFYDLLKHYPGIAVPEC